MKKLRVGLFSFTCDEGCSIVFLEILNDTFFRWKDSIDIVYSRVLKTKNDMKNLDIAFVEGCISGTKEAEKLKEIRNNTKKLVAIGSCAITGAPSNIRNFFDKDRLKEIEPILKKFNYRENISPLSEIVKVDESVPGCPMDEKKFIEVVEKHIKELKESD